MYDPLVDWTQSEDAAFPLAVKATVEQGRLSRKEMEREVASGMLVTRLAESGPHWQRNRWGTEACVSRFSLFVVYPIYIAS